MPPTTSTFLARRLAGFRQPWSTASPTFLVRMMLLLRRLRSVNSLAASLGGIQLAEPCSSPRRKVPARSTAWLQAAHTATSPMKPKSSGIASVLRGPCAMT